MKEFTKNTNNLLQEYKPRIKVKILLNFELLITYYIINLFYGFCITLCKKEE